MIGIPLLPPSKEFIMLLGRRKNQAKVDYVSENVYLLLIPPKGTVADPNTFKQDRFENLSKSFIFNQLNTCNY